MQPSDIEIVSYLPTVSYDRRISLAAAASQRNEHHIPFRVKGCDLPHGSNVKTLASGQFHILLRLDESFQSSVVAPYNRRTRSPPMCQFSCRLWEVVERLQTVRCFGRASSELRHNRGIWRGVLWMRANFPPAALVAPSHLSRSKSQKSENDVGSRHSHEQQPCDSNGIMTAICDGVSDQGR